MADTPTTTRAPRATKPATDKTRNNFAGTLANLKTYIEIKIQALSDVAGPNPSEVTKARIEELQAIQARLESK
jgi:hypothetical protein